MPELTTYMTTREASILADNLSRFGGKNSLVTRLATMEVQCRTASRLIRALLKHVNPSDVFQLPPEA